MRRRVRTGYLAVALEGAMAEALRATVETQQALGIAARLVSREDAQTIHPWLNLDHIALCAHEAEAGFADPYMTASAFVRAARRGGATIRQGTPVRALLHESSRVTGVRTDAGDITAGVVISALNVWSPVLRGWVGADIPCHASRHLVASFAADAPSTRDFPVLKNFAAPRMLYSRPHAGPEILVGSGDAGDPVADPDGGTGDIPMDWVAEVGEQLAHRMPRLAEHGRWFCKADRGPKRRSRAACSGRRSGIG